MGGGNHLSWELNHSHNLSSKLQFSHTRHVVCLALWWLMGVSVAFQVTVEEESFLAHPTRNRAKIQHSRRPPTRGHLMAVVSAGGGREQNPLQPAELLLLPLPIAASVSAPPRPPPERRGRGVRGGDGTDDSS